MRGLVAQGVGKTTRPADPQRVVRSFEARTAVACPALIRCHAASLGSSRLCGFASTRPAGPHLQCSSCSRANSFAPRFIPTIGRLHAVALRFVRSDALTEGLAPPSVRVKKPPEGGFLKSNYITPNRGKQCSRDRPNTLLLLRHLEQQELSWCLTLHELNPCSTHHHQSPSPSHAPICQERCWYK